MVLKKIAALAALCIGFAAPVQATTIVNLIGTVVDLPSPGLNGPLAGTVGTGTLTYNETLLTGAGDEVLGLAGNTSGWIQDESFDLSFSIFGETYTQTSVTGFPNQPSAVFSNGVLGFIGFGLADGRNGVDLSSLGAETLGFFRLFTYDSTEDAYRADIAIRYAAPVPLPAGLPLLLAGLGAFALVRRKTSK